MRVAIDEGPLHGPRTGIGNAVGWLLDALADDAAGAVEIVPYLTSMRARITPPTRRLPLPALVAHRLWARTAFPRFDRWLGSPDVVHGTNYVVPPTRCPSVVSVYDCWFLEHPELAQPDVARAGAVLTAAVDRGAHVVACSEATAERVRQLLHTDRVTAIPLGPPVAAPPTTSGPSPTPRLGHLDQGPFIVSIGTMERRKNLPTLIAAFARLAAEHPSVRLVIAGGDGDDRPTVDRALAGLDDDARRRVALLGRITDAEKSWLLRKARALAYPSRDEGFGFPILEAQQAGIAVVASTAGSIPEVAGTGALLSTPNDAHALAANLHWVVTNDRRRDELIAKGHQNLTRFSWADTAARHVELYEKVAATR